MASAGLLSVRLVNDLTKIQKIQTDWDWEDEEDNLAERVSQYLGETGEVVRIQTRWEAPADNPKGEKREECELDSKGKHKGYKDGKGWLRGVDSSGLARTQMDSLGFT